MKNLEIARILHNIADIMELQEVPFKPRRFPYTRIRTYTSIRKNKKAGSRNPVNVLNNELTSQSSKYLILKYIYKSFGKNGDSEAGLAEPGRRTPLKCRQNQYLTGLAGDETERLSQSSGFKTLGLELRVPDPALNHFSTRSAT